MTLADLAVIIVHHRSYETLSATMESLFREGVEAAQVVIVDNSEDVARRTELERSLLSGMHVIYTANKGYGAAVNVGIAWHSERTKSGFILVSTHESKPEPGALCRLLDAMRADDKAALAGPTLVTGKASDTIWSMGGYVTKFLGLPRHHAHGLVRSEVEVGRSRAVEWVDGAFVLFRRDVLTKWPLDERYFLYMEEVDHQLGIRQEGWKVLLVSSAVVWQSSAGTPSYYQARNIHLFQHKNGNRVQRLLAAPMVVGKAVIRGLVKGGISSEWRPLLRGWRDGMGIIRQGSRIGHSGHYVDRKVCVVNPLGGALAHYTEALLVLLKDAGVETALYETDEPSLAGTGRWHWAFEYIRLLRLARGSAASRTGRTVLVTWPVFGFLDLLLVKALCGSSSSIIYHDPKPLVRSVGSGLVASRLMRWVPDKPRTIVHSEQAKESLIAARVNAEIDLILHPMFRPPKHIHGIVEGQSKIVRVLGQYKQDRDMELLSYLASSLNSRYSLEIVGRGWPPVEGWRVDARFVPEDELDNLLATSDVILIPYKRFYQSGIAVRAVESGTPVVGRAESSLADIFGASSPLLVNGDENDPATKAAWAASIEYAVAYGREDAVRSGEHMYRRAVSEWTNWARSRCRLLQA